MNKVVVCEERFKELIRLECYVEQKLNYESLGETFKFMVEHCEKNIRESITKLKKFQ